MKHSRGWPARKGAAAIITQLRRRRRDYFSGPLGSTEGGWPAREGKTRPAVQRGMFETRPAAQPGRGKRGNVARHAEEEGKEESK